MFIVDYVSLSVEFHLSEFYLLFFSTSQLSSSDSISLHIHEFLYHLQYV